MASAPAARAFLARPVVRAALTSATVMAAGDALCQALRANAAGRPLSLSTLDAASSARFGLVGLTLHGPYFLRAFRWLDALPVARLGGGRLQQAALRTLAGQTTVFPVYLVAFFTEMGLLEGLSAR
jgi:protein Mpv17